MGVVFIFWDMMGYDIRGVDGGFCRFWGIVCVMEMIGGSVCCIELEVKEIFCGREIGIIFFGFIVMEGLRVVFVNFLVVCWFSFFVRCCCKVCWDVSLLLSVICWVRLFIVSWFRGCVWFVVVLMLVVSCWLIGIFVGLRDCIVFVLLMWYLVFCFSNILLVVVKFVICFLSFFIFCCNIEFFFFNNW